MLIKIHNTRDKRFCAFKHYNIATEINKMLIKSLLDNT